MFILINKPAGWTSFDAVNYIRGKARAKTGNKKIAVGHAGTLDPFATGLLIIGVGREFTKRLDEFKKLPKTYVATIKLGEVSDTFDVTGKITKIEDSRLKIDNERQLNNLTIEQLNNEIPTWEQILTCINSFTGRQLQTPPMHSAKQIGGVRLYKLARQGKTVEREPNEIEIFDLKLLDYSWPILKIEVTCSSGTYIRSLANDIGEKLGVGGYCHELTRTKIGDYKLADAKDIKNLDEIDWTV